MKAAVLKQLGEAPQFSDFKDPVIENNQQLLLSVKAAAIKNIDRLRASGKHYASYKEVPVVVGIDGMGVLENGKRVYAMGITGMIAEKALISSDNYVEVPDALDNFTAAALPNAALGAAVAMVYRAQIKKGDVVLINGATGVTGQIAVQLAHYYGASKIIATGRNKVLLKHLKQLGADECIVLDQNEAELTDRYRQIHQSSPINIVVDYLWGRPIELILSALKGGGMNVFTKKVTIVTVGSMAGETIQLASGTLRSSAFELMGSGIGSISKEAMHRFNTELLPELFLLAAQGKLKIETIDKPLDTIESSWNAPEIAGKRLVITI